MNDRQKRFCREYIIDLNGKEAAIRAGYSEHTAKVIACQNLTKLYLKEEIARLLTKRDNKLELTAESILESIIEIRDRCIKEGNSKFDASNALKANELLGRHMKMFTDKHEVAHSGDMAVTIVNDIK